MEIKTDILCGLMKTVMAGLAKQKSYEAGTQFLVFNIAVCNMFLSFILEDVGHDEVESVRLLKALNDLGLKDGLILKRVRDTSTNIHCPDDMYDWKERMEDYAKALNEF